MIRAMIFDLDGTLVQTEKLKALSYAKAAVALCPYDLDEAEVIEAFKDVVGRSRREVAIALVERFELAPKARGRQNEFGVREPWQAFVQVRLQYYRTLLSDPEVIRNNQWPHNMLLLQQARDSDCKVGLATMSHCDQVQIVIGALNLNQAFDFIATRDDVDLGKPAPEIYQLVAAELEVNPGDCLVIEDSPTGVQAALATGMPVIAVATPFTRSRLHASGLLPAKNILDDPNEVTGRVAQIIEAHASL